MIPRRSSSFGQFRPPTMELSALEHLQKHPHRLIMGKMVFSLFLDYCFDPIFLILAGNENIH